MINLKESNIEKKNGSVYIKHPSLTGKKGMVMFKAEWCGHCQRAKPEMKKVSNILGSSFPVCMIDCDENPKAAKMAGIEGYPTIKFVDAKGKITGDYNGERSHSEIIKTICRRDGVCKK